MNKGNKKEGTILSRYLNWAGFTLQETKAKFVIRNWLDFIGALAYTIISVVLICIQQADLVVFGLNILCLFRAMLNNTMYASDLTRRCKKVDIEEKREGHSHYHIKAAILITFFVIAVITWTVLLSESNSDTMLIKIFASLCILVVLLNDSENIIVFAYNASIEL